jgi:hypothetical protein
MSVSKVIHVRSPNPKAPFEDWVQVNFHNFKDLPSEKNELVRSSNFMCAGHEWNLMLYPGGGNNAQDGMVSVYLFSELTSRIAVAFEIILKKKCGGNFQVLKEETIEFPNEDGTNWGWHNFVSRQQILDNSTGVLDHGTVTFEVRIRPHSDYYCRGTKPGPTLSENIFTLFADEGSADVAFDVKGRLLFAHKLVLKLQVPSLLELSESFDKTNSFTIKDVEPDVFETMLKFVYGKPICAVYWKEHSRQILEASGKYVFTDLKSEAEAWCVKNLKLTKDNAIDELLSADGKSCQLLKKAVMKFIVEHGDEVIESDSYDMLDESPKLRKEVMKAMIVALSEKK